MTSLYVGSMHYIIVYLTLVMSSASSPIYWKRLLLLLLERVDVVLVLDRYRNRTVQAVTTTAATGWLPCCQSSQQYLQRPLRRPDERQAGPNHVLLPRPKPSLWQEKTFLGMMVSYLDKVMKNDRRSCPKILLILLSVPKLLQKPSGKLQVIKQPV